MRILKTLTKFKISKIVRARHYQLSNIILGACIGNNMGPQRQATFLSNRNSNTHRLDIKTHSKPPTFVSSTDPRFHTPRIAAATLATPSENQKSHWKSLRTNHKGNKSPTQKLNKYRTFPYSVVSRKCPL